MITSMRGCVACDDLWPWPISSRSFDLDSKSRVRSVASTVLDGFFLYTAQMITIIRGCVPCYVFLRNWKFEKKSSVLDRGVTIRLATIRYISRYTAHDMVHDTIQNQLIYYQWKILKHCGMCHQYCYIKTVILARNSEFKINKDVHNHPCPKYLLLTNCVCKQNNKIS